MDKSRILAFLTLALICFSSIAFSQEPVVTTAVPFLLINPSAEANGQSNAGISRITDDPFAFILNPAQLGLFGPQNSFAFSFYPEKTPWLPAFGLKDLTYDSKVIACSMSPGKNTTIPLSVGFAYTRVDLNLGTFNRTGPNGPEIIGTFHAEEHADAFSFGVGADLRARIAFGITFRRIVSNLAPFGAAEEAGTGSAKAWSNDIGLLLQIPVPRLIRENPELIPGIQPVFDISLGTALTNVGGKLTYIDAAQADPLPRTISLGTTIELGIGSSKIGLRFFTFSWSHESASLLVDGDSSGSYYRGGFGDIDFAKNIIMGKRTRMIELSKGWELGVLETAYARGGSFDGTGQRAFATTGFGLRTTGLFRILKEKIERNTIWSFIVSHLDIRYDHSEINSSDLERPLLYTKFSSIALKVSF
jgi:hypothetical protein